VVEAKRGDVMIEPGGDPETELFAVPPSPRRTFFTQSEAARELGLGGSGSWLIMALIAGANITTYRVAGAHVIDEVGMDRLRTAFERYQTIKSKRGRPRRHHAVRSGSKSEVEVPS
jgi:hypothetical protein